MCMSSLEKCILRPSAHFSTGYIPRKNYNSRASLVVRWLRVNLAMQEMLVRSLVREDLTRHGAAKPMSHNYQKVKKWKCQSLSRVQLFVTLWTAALQASLFMGFPRQEYWSGLSFLPPGDLPNPGTEPRFSALQADSLLTEPPGKPQNYWAHV